MNRSCTYLILPLTVTMRLPSRGYSTDGGGVGNCTPQDGVFQQNQQLTQGLCLSHWVTLQSRTSHIKLLLLILIIEAKCPHDWSVRQKKTILLALPLVYLEWVRANKKMNAQVNLNADHHHHLKVKDFTCTVLKKMQFPNAGYNLYPLNTWQ